MTVLASPYIRRLFDRQGVRPSGAPCAARAGARLCWLTPDPWHFTAVFGVVPIVGAGTSSMCGVLARRRTGSRGQTFGAALAGIGIGGALLSPVTQLMISGVGWRGALIDLALLNLLVTPCR